MKYLSLFACALLLVANASLADHHDRPAHYKGKPSANLAEAVTNFREANAKLAQLVAGELSNADVAAVHETTYTLENALAVIQAEVTKLADTLEDVHVASETVDRDTIKAQGAAYLRVTDELAKLGAGKH